MTESDETLLQRFVDAGDESAFTEIVRRHLNVVYSAALRQVGGDTQLAQDVTQVVFTEFARRAAVLAGHPIIVGWLFTSTRFTAAKVVHRERARRIREGRAHAMQEILNDEGPNARWEEVRPVLDEALAELKPADRDVVLLRYFESCGYAQLGRTLGISEDAARMRVERALAQLRTRLARRGVTSTAAALGAALGSHAVVAAPSGLLPLVSSTALAGISGGSALLTSFMTMTKLQIGFAGLVVMASSTGFIVQARTNAALRDELASLRTQGDGLAELRTENTKLAQTAAETADLRRDDTALARIGDEATALKQKLQSTAQVQTASTPADILDGAPVYELADVDQRPALKAHPNPEYPSALRAKGVAGNVRLDFLIDAKGSVRNAKVLKSTQPEFEEPALEAIKQWKYEPAAKGGQTVNVHVQMAIRFTTDETEPTHGTH